MGKEKTKAYIVTLKFGIWENQLWFEAEDSTEKGTDFEVAKDTLDKIAADSANAADFFNKAVAHFESYGFDRIQK